MVGVGNIDVAEGPATQGVGETERPAPCGAGRSGQNDGP